MVDVGSHNIMENTKGAKEMGWCPWSWIIIFTELNLYTHHWTNSLKFVTYGTQLANAMPEVQIKLVFFSAGGRAL